MECFVTIFLFISATSYAQNTPVVEKSAPASNNTLPSSGALGSNSGVNPLGNPGTIANSTSNSNAINSTLAPHPNIDKGTFLTSSPSATATIPGSNAPVAVDRKTSAPTNATTVVKNETAPVEIAPVITEAPPVVISTKKTDIKNKTLNQPENVLPAYTLVPGNQISPSVEKRIKTKFGTDLYDITKVKIEGTSEMAYLVRTLIGGKLAVQIFFDR